MKKVFLYFFVIANFIALQSHALCTGKPSAGKAITGLDICLNDTITLRTVFSNPGVGGLTFQWQMSLNDLPPWNNVPSMGTDSTCRVLVTTKYRYYRVIFTCTASGLSDTSVSAEVVYPQNLPYNEGVENILLIGKDKLWNCWKVYLDPSKTGEIWTAQVGRTGIGYGLNSGPPPAYPKTMTHNTMLIAPAFELQAGKTYRYSFFHKESAGNLCWDSMYVVWGRNNARDSMTNRVGRTLYKFSFDDYVRFWIDFTPTVDGIYYFGIVVQDNDATKGDINFDDFQLKEVFPCQTAPDIKKGRAFTPKTRDAKGKRDQPGNQSYCIGDTIVVTYDDDTYRDQYTTPPGTAPYFDYTGMTYQLWWTKRDSDYHLVDTIKLKVYNTAGITSTTYKQVNGNIFYKIDSLPAGFNLTIADSVRSKFEVYKSDSLCHVTNISDYQAVNIIATDTNTFYRFVATCVANGKKYESDSVLVNGTKALPWCTKWEEVSINPPPEKPIKKPNGSGGWNSHEVCPKCWIGLPSGSWTSRLKVAPPPLNFLPQSYSGQTFVYHTKGTTRRHLVTPPARLHKGRGYRFSFYWSDNNDLQNIRSNGDSLYVALGRTANMFLTNPQDAYNTTPLYTQDRFYRASHMRLNYSTNPYVLQTSSPEEKYQQFWFDYSPPDTATYYFAVYSYGISANNGAMTFYDNFCLDTIAMAGCSDTPVIERIVVNPGNKELPFATPDDRWCSGTIISMEMRDPQSGTSKLWKYGYRLQWQYSLNGGPWTDSPGDTTNYKEFTLTNARRIWRLRVTNPCGLEVYSDSIDVQAPGAVLPWREDFETGTGPDYGTLPRCWLPLPSTHIWSMANFHRHGGESKAYGCGQTRYMALQRVHPNPQITATPTNFTAVAPGFYLEKDSTYRFSFWYKDNGVSNPWDVVQAMWGMTPLTVTNNLVPSVNSVMNKEYRYYTAEYTATTSADHYFGVNVVEATAPATIAKMKVFDNFEFKKKYLNDLIVVSLDTPTSKCGLSSAVQVSMQIMNIGSVPQSNFNVGYSVDGGTKVGETFTGTINPGEIKSYSFTTKANLSTPKKYDLKLWTGLASDQDVWDDTLVICQKVENRFDPPIPAKGNDTFCLSSTAEVKAISAPGANTYWYKNATDIKPINIGNSLFVPNINKDTFFLVQSSTKFSTNLPPFFNNLGGAGTGTGGTGLVFDVFGDKCDSVLLESVDVYAAAPGTTIQVELRNNLGVTIRTSAVTFLPDQGRNVVELNWTIAQGTGYQLINLTSGSLAINNAGALYPYPVSASYNGMISITGPTNPNANASNYNYFYNWKIACSGCMSTKDTLWVRTKLGPSMDLGPDTSRCSYPVDTLKAIPNMVSYLWNTGATTQGVPILTTGTYKVSVVSSTGCLITDTVRILVTESPKFDLRDTFSCVGDTVQVTTGLNPFYYLHSWNTGSLDTFLNITTPGKYTATVYDMFNFCSRTDTLRVKSNPLPVVNLGSDGIRCGTSINLDATPAAAGIYNYKWDDLSTTATRNVIVDGFYYVQVENDSTKCKGRDSVDIVLKTAPVVNLGKDTNVCGNTLVLQGPTAANLRYLWNTTQTSANINVSLANQYWLEAQDTLTGCKMRDTISVDFLKVPDAELGADRVLCAKNTTVSVPACIGCTYEWTPNVGNTSSVTFDFTNNGRVKVKVSNSCYSSQDSMMLDLQSMPTTELLTQKNITSCGNIQLSATNNPEGKNISWTGGVKGNTILVTKSGSYSVAVNNTCGTANETVQVKIDQPAVPDFTINYPGKPMTIGLIDNSIDATEYDWDFGDGNTSKEVNPIHTYTREGTFAVTLTVKNTCGVKSVTKYTFKITKPVTAVRDNLLNSGVRLYPNPSSSYVTLEISGVKEGSYKIEIQDMVGKKLMEERVSSQQQQLKKQLDVTQFAAGQYQVIITDKDGHQLQRMIVVE